MAIQTTGKTPSAAAPAGTHPARCYSVIDLGTQTFSWQGKDSSQRKILIQFELPTETHVFKDENGPEPFSVSKEITSYMGKNTRGFLEGWRGKPFSESEAMSFDVEKLLGAAAMLNVTNKPKKSGLGVWADIASASPLPKGFACPPAVNKPVSLSLEPQDFKQEVYEALPEWIRKKIAESPEFQALSGGSSGAQGDGGWPPEDDSDSIPF